MFYNNLLSIPVLLIATFLLEDWSAANVAKNFPPGQSGNIFTAMAISGLSSVFISYTSAWCVRVTSSTTYSMVGMLNKLPVSIAGIIFFNAPVTFASFTAIIFGFFSGIIYAIAKVRQKAAAALNAGLPTTQPPLSASSASQRDGLRN
jgi:GDP-mannose transporter